jgi:hypothetical protein
VHALLRHTRDALEDRGDWDAVTERWTALRARGTSTDRQRELLRKGVEHRELVAALVAETQQG